MLWIQGQSTEGAAMEPMSRTIKSSVRWRWRLPQCRLHPIQTDYWLAPWWRPAVTPVESAWRRHPRPYLKDG